MAVAFGRANAFSGAGASPLNCANVLNLGETVVAGATFNPTTLAVTGVTDNAGGGSPTYASRGALNQSTNIRGECWSTGAGSGKAATSVAMAFSGTNTDSGLLVGAYIGVLALGNFTITSGTTANPTVSLSVQDNNGWIVAGFACKSTVTPTALTGSLRKTDADVSIVQALVDNTRATPGSVTCAITLAANPWVAWALELRPVSGAAAVLGGSILSATTESDVVSGGKVITLTVSGTTWIP